MLLSNIVTYVTNALTFTGTKLVEVVNAVGTAGFEVIKKVLLID